MPRKSKFNLLLCFFLSLFILTGFACESQDKEQSTAEQEASKEQEKQTKPESYKVGAVLRLSKGASDGIPARHGIEIAVDMINEQGGINGTPLEVLYYDSKDDATTAVNAVQKLISVHNVQAIIGPMMSGNVLAAAPICEQNEVVLLTPTGTSPKISQAGKYTFRLCSRIDYQAKALVNEALDQAEKEDPSVAIIYSNEPYGKGCKNLFMKYLEENGVEPMAVESFQRGDKDFQAQLTKIKSEDPDILFIPGYLQETAPLISQARQMGLSGLSVGVFGDMAPQYIELAGEAAEGHLIAGEYNDDQDTEANQEFVAAYDQKLQANPKASENIMFAALTYDAVNILEQALEDGNTKGPQIQEFLTNLQDYPGITGDLSFDENGDVQKGGIYLFQVKNGEYQKIE